MNKLIGLLLCSFFLLAGTPLTMEENSSWEPDMWQDAMYEFVVKRHKIIDPVCNVCGSSEGLVVHQIVPLFNNPFLMFEHSNYVTLCYSRKWGFDCRTLAGFGGRDYQENPWVMEDIKVLRVISNPEYIKKHGSVEFSQYKFKMLSRVLKYNREKYPKRRFSKYGTLIEDPQEKWKLGDN